MMLHPIFLAVALALAAAPALAAGGGDAEAPARTAQLPAITVATVAPATLRDVVRASGSIGPVERVFVQPRIEGQAIEEVLAEVGDQVAEGQVLARLSDDALKLQRSQLAAQRASAEAAIAQARASLVEAEAARDEALRSTERTRALRAQGAVSEAALDQANAAATTSEARVAVATEGLTAAEAQRDLVDAQIADVELNLARTEIAAPVAGEIVERSAQLGAIATGQGGPMFVIVRDGALELRAEVAEADLLRLAPGQPADVRAVGLSQPIAGRVRLVEPVIDAATRLGTARIWLGPSGAVRSGLFAEAEILVAERTALALPLTAVATDREGAHVLRVTPEGVVERVAVTTGIRDGGLIEIVSGLSEGEAVVARAGAFVRPGDRITPVPAEDPAEDPLAAAGN